MNFILIDDEPTNNLICSIAVKKSFTDVKVTPFTSAEAGLKYITGDFAQSGENATLFLDINMPGMNGWDFLDEFEKQDETLKGHLKIFVLSSSFNISDKERALSYPIVFDYITKPITIPILKGLDIQ